MIKVQCELKTLINNVWSKKNKLQPFYVIVRDKRNIGQLEGKQENVTFFLINIKIIWGTLQG